MDSIMQWDSVLGIAPTACIALGNGETALT